MNTAPMQPKSKGQPRRAVVIVAVLVVIVILSLAGYQYSDAMLSEYKASETKHRSVQAKAFADSGIRYAAAMLSSQNNFNNTLQGNAWNNPQFFQAQPVVDENGQTVGYFSIIAPPDPLSGDMTDPLYGVLDEGGKINLNASMKFDPTGQLLYNTLMSLPNMTDAIAYAIVSWLGGSVGQANGGAQNDYYMGLTPPYQCRNGPIDSIDELLLVQGVTRDLLYGADWNRNGTLDTIEQGSTAGVTNTTSNSFDRGWSAFLTVHSREPNYDPYGNAFIYLNNTDMSQLYPALQLSGLSQGMVNFIMMYRQYGPYNAPSNSQGTGSSPMAAPASGGGGGGGTQTTTVQADPAGYTVSLTTAANKSGNINSLFSLVNVSVAIQSTDPVTKKAVTTVYPSPLNDSGMLLEQLPLLFTVATLIDPTQNTEMPARININTAPPEVLATIPGLQETDIQQILAIRPSLATPQTADPVFQTPTWLYTEAQLSLQTLQAVVGKGTSSSTASSTTSMTSSSTGASGASTGGSSPALPTSITLDNLITTRTQVFRVQSVGYFEGNKGPVIRLEAIVDTNSGRPRIIAWRNLTELGKGWTGTPP